MSKYKSDRYSKQYSRNLKFLPFKILCKGLDNKEQFLTKESFPKREQYYNCFFTLCDFAGKGTAECWSQTKGSCIFIEMVWDTDNYVCLKVK